MRVDPKESNDFTRLATTLRDVIAHKGFASELGTVKRVSDGRITASLKRGFLGEVCELSDRASGRRIPAQIVAIDNGDIILAPLAPADGLSMATEVRGSGEALSVDAGDWLIGRVVDALGRPLDNQPVVGERVRRPITGTPIDPLSRPVISEIFETGIRSVDLFNLVGRGQRMAIFGMPGSGKSTLLSMLARHAEADVVVYAMIGERGREVRDFLERHMTEEVRRRTVAVVSTSDRPAIERVIAGHSAHAIAEQFRAQGKNVLLLFDSVTRFARALREVGLAAGEQAVRQGMTPSVYAELPRLIERSGLSETGSITTFYTVLLENDGVNDAVAEEVTSLTDGHIILDAKLAASGHYPAIEVLKSKSRLMREIAPPGLARKASVLRGLMSKYLDIELLIQVGEYRPGNDAEYDRAIAARPLIAKLTSQETDAGMALGDSIAQMDAVLNAVQPETL